jgi:hypothetical protein
MLSNLAVDIRRYVHEVRQRPSSALGAPLDDLERAANRSFDGAFAAIHAPIARYTFMLRSILDPTKWETDEDQVELDGDTEIVGMFPQLLLLDLEADGTKLPPIEAIDVSFSVNNPKDLYTSTGTRRRSQEDNTQVVSLAAMSSTIPRLLGIECEGASPKVAAKFRWAVPDLALVADRDWGKTQVSLNLFVRPRNAGGRR